MAASDSTCAHQQLPACGDGEFRNVLGFPGYAACSDGSVWSCWKPTGRPLYLQKQSSTWKRLKPYPRKEDGRARFRLKSETGTYVRIYGSHVILMAFFGPRPDGAIACHNNGNCLDDSISNLRWDSDLENHRDMIRHGTQVRGANHPKAKLSDADVDSILTMRGSGIALKSIADVFGVSEQRVWQITRKGSR